MDVVIFVCKASTWKSLDFKRALIMYKIAIQQNPYNPSIYYCYGLLLNECSQYKKANKYLNKSYKLNKNIGWINQQIDKDRIKVKQNMVKFGSRTSFYDVAFWADICGLCGKRGKKFKKCSRCKSTRYCCRKCQKKHWNFGHRIQCKTISKSTPYHKMYYHVLNSKQSLIMFE